MGPERPAGAQWVRKGLQGHSGSGKACRGTVGPERPAGAGFLVVSWVEARSAPPLHLYSPLLLLLTLHPSQHSAELLERLLAQQLLHATGCSHTPVVLHLLSTGAV